MNNKLSWIISLLSLTNLGLLAGSLYSERWWENKNSVVSIHLGVLRDCQKIVKLASFCGTRKDILSFKPGWFNSDRDLLVIELCVAIFASFVHFCMYIYSLCQKRLGTCGHVLSLIACCFALLGGGACIVSFLLMTKNLNMLGLAPKMVCGAETLIVIASILSIVHCCKQRKRGHEATEH